MVYKTLSHKKVQIKYTLSTLRVNQCIKIKLKTKLNIYLITNSTLLLDIV